MAFSWRADDGPILPQNALKLDCNGKCIERIEGHYLEVVVLLYIECLLGRSVIFWGILTSIAKKPYMFVIF